MNIGKLRHRVTIQKINGFTTDAGGGRIPNWEDVITVWANVKPLRGDEVINAQKKGTEYTHTVDIRYRPGITAQNNRIQFNARIFTIQSVINTNEQNISLSLYCKEVG